MRKIFPAFLAAVAMMRFAIPFAAEVTKNGREDPRTRVPKASGAPEKQNFAIEKQKPAIEKRKPAMERRTVGQMPDGKEVEQFTFHNANGLEVKVLAYGATITAVKVPDRDGHFESVTLSLDPPANYLTIPSVLGSVIGRFANRISGAKFTLDGIEYVLPSASRSGYHIHGGKEGFQRMLWKAAPIQDAKSVGVKLSHVNPDGHEGYPGILTAEVVYRLTDDNELWMEYAATTDKPTVINMTNHAYWNLAGAGSGDVLGHVLTLRADRYLATGENIIPTGEYRGVQGTPLDFTRPRAIGLEIAQLSPGTYDHCFVLNESPESLPLAARVVEPKTGRVMEVYTTQPAVQFYVPPQLGNNLTGGGAPGGQHPGFCLETQHFPDSPNKPAFPSTVLRPGETYKQVTMHKFSVQK